MASDMPAMPAIWPEVAPRPADLHHGGRAQSVDAQPASRNGARAGRVSRSRIHWSESCARVNGRLSSLSRMKVGRRSQPAIIRISSCVIGTQITSPFFFWITLMPGRPSYSSIPNRS